MRSRMAGGHHLTFAARSSHDDTRSARPATACRVASLTGRSDSRATGRRLASMPTAMSSASASSPTLGQRACGSRSRAACTMRAIAGGTQGAASCSGRRLARGDLEHEPHERAHVGERRRARERVVERHRQAEDVAADVHVLGAHGLLGRHVLRRPHEAARRGQGARGRPRRRTPWRGRSPSPSRRRRRARSRGRGSTASRRGGRCRARAPPPARRTPGRPGRRRRPARGGRRDRAPPRGPRLRAAA